jgi:hypothetical protein
MTVSRSSHVSRIRAKQRERERDMTHVEGEFQIGQLVRRRNDPLGRLGRVVGFATFAEGPVVLVQWTDAREFPNPSVEPVRALEAFVDPRSERPQDPENPRA